MVLCMLYQIIWLGGCFIVDIVYVISNHLARWVLHCGIVYVISNHLARWVLHCGYCVCYIKSSG